MQILSVALTNFKTHRDRQFNFQLGTNAICGENGAGKTSILEAIAWVLFNYQGSYKKEDLIRNGASSAKANVTFISSRDSRTYDVQRSTSGGYILFDPQLNERLPLTRTKDEVLPWLRHHLGVAPATDLGQLFANTIGVPQGTFTADFLLSTEKRKPIFDTILKVEEYRETYKQSINLKKYAEAQVQRLKDLVAQYEEALEGWEELKNRHQQLKTEISLGESQLAGLEEKSKQLAKRRKDMLTQAEQVQKLRTEITALSSQIKAQEQTQNKLDETFEKARAAEEICQAKQTEYDAFLATEKQIQVLNENNHKRQAVLKQQQAHQQAIAQSQNNLSRLSAKLEQFEEAEKALAQLAGAVTTQNQLETELADVQTQMQALTNAQFQIKTLNKQLGDTTGHIAQIQDELKRLSGLQASIAQIPEWEAQKNRLQSQLSRLAAAQQFETELQALIQGGQAKQDEYRQQVAASLKTLERWKEEFETLEPEDIKPIRNALFQGGLLSKETLEKLNGILADLTEQTDPTKLKTQQNSLQSQLSQAYAKQGEVKGIETQEAKLGQLKKQQKEIQTAIDAIAQTIKNETEITQAAAQLNTQLQQLGNPKGKQALLTQTLTQRAEVQKAHTEAKAAQEKEEKALTAITTELSSFDKIDAQLQQQQTLKQTHQAGYLLFLQNQQMAKQMDALKQEKKDAIALLNQQQKKHTKLEKELAQLTETFDPEAFTHLDKQYSDINSQADRLRGSLPQLQQRFSDLEKQMAGLEAIAQKRDQAQADIKQRDRLRRFVNYARKVYKDAGPRITERYVHNISREADRLFRELLGRANVALTWSADYEITVQEGAHTRRFINLSGGEQMCAALAVRLALLKVLADIDVAFFDEPTTNMDRPRRASLAEAITRLSSFKQLFVISHDDTFEHVTETVIMVEREA